MKRQSNQSSSVAINLVLLAIFVVVVSVMWQRTTDRQKLEQAEKKDTVFVSALGEFEFTIPADWTIGENSIEDQGVAFIELLGPRNDVVNNAFTSQDEIQSLSIEEAFGNERFNELLGTSVGREYILLQIEALTSFDYELPTSKQAWRDDLESSETTASGVAYSEFEDIAVQGADGYRYEVTIFESEQQLKAVTYYLLGEQAEIEVIIFPADSNYIAQAEEIVRSIIVTTDDEAFEGSDAL